MILGLSEIGPRQEEASPQFQGPKSSEKIFKLVKVKDRFTTFQEDGYRDICLNVEVAWVSEMDSNRQVSDIIYMYLIWIFAR